MYCTSAVLTVLRFATACDSFAACRDRNKLGIAMVAMIKMIATTINYSSNENPLVVLMTPVPPLGQSSMIDESSQRRLYCKLTATAVMRRINGLRKGNKQTMTICAIVTRTERY